MITYNYSIIRITPNPVRSESVNIGMVVVTPTGPDVRVLESVNKIRAISKEFGTNELERLKSKLETLLSDRLTLAEAVNLFQGSINLSEIGTFNASNDFEYEEAVDKINFTFITPEKAKKKTVVSQKRIITELKSQFSRYGIMGKNIDDIYNHKVVQNYPLSHDQGLYAELILKNGIYHLTETLDLRVADIKQKTGESAFKAITMNAARNLWNKEVNTILVYAADFSTERVNSQQLALASSYSDKTFNLLSNEDMGHYFNHMLSAAGMIN
ncbi:DUF3037 domain-containing protein [Rosenbergiella sp. S61]|uniref:DUF3037 domain-containing protein n=1 Tax=Rosenbergiella gaditana TaxID=2726987 RepID=A0ABS5T1Q3_9GAMM|nr:DUF3037 domain-containing protein [Rosenbergiella gaditana]MBT0725445.1 DUF3037 domain-containing protein [Rosenbergiella gaditana]